MDNADIDPELASFDEEGLACPVGLARRRGGGWDYLMARKRGKTDEFLAGELSFRGFTGVLGPPLRSWTPGARAAAVLLRADRPPLGLKVDSWEISGVCFVAGPKGWAPAPDGEPLRELKEEDLRGARWNAIVADETRSYYWSDRFDHGYYAAQARAGCIATAADRGDRVFLMPELQEAYAVLDWENIKATKSAARLMKPERLAALGVELRVSLDPRRVLDALDAQWKEESWLLPPYRDLMLRIAEERPGGLSLLAVELRSGGELAAGELGYAIGSVYTSLTGFFRRERAEWNGLGIAQLHLLARALRESGFSFWNLGHPYMRYKQELGARVLQRAEFLARWKDAIRAEAVLPVTSGEGSPRSPRSGR